MQYGSKEKTGNRIFKKLLRTYLVLTCYFPKYSYNIAFCSPKVRPATEEVILEYFEILKQDFKSTCFSYYSNEEFHTEILQNVLEKTVQEKCR